MKNITSRFDEPKLKVITFGQTDIITTSYFVESDEELTTTYFEADDEPTPASLGPDLL